jgi:hypothetical protein
MTNRTANTISGEKILREGSKKKQCPWNHPTKRRRANKNTKNTSYKKFSVKFNVNQSGRTKGAVHIMKHEQRGDEFCKKCMWRGDGSRATVERSFTDLPPQIRSCFQYN